MVPTATRPPLVTWFRSGHGALDRLRVLERGSSVATAYCGRLLGSLGADVLKVEPPEGDPQRRSAPVVPTPDGESRSARFEYLNCYKSSVVLDEGDPDGRALLDGLLASSDIVVDRCDGTPERIQADYERARDLNPRLVYVALSGFGLTGPYRHYRSNDFLELAAGGQMYITGDPDREPVQSGGPTAGYASGATGAYAALAAVAQADLDGQGQLVDVGAMEVLAGLHQWTLTLFSHQGYVKRRAGNRYAESYHPIGLFQCRDGWISLAVSGPASWEAFCLALDLPELLVDERFETGGDRFDHADQLDELITPRLLELSTDDAVAILQEQRVPVAPVFGMHDVLADHQLEAREFWVPHPGLGEGARMPARAFHLPDDPPFRVAPALGDATLRVRSELDRVSSPTSPGHDGEA